MRKELIVVLILFLVSLGILYVIQDVFISPEQLREGFPIDGIYSFNVVFSLVLLVVLTYASKKESAKDNIGYLYLGSVLMKPFLFIIVFHSLFFDAPPISKKEALCMLLPTLIALFFEVLYCAKILKGLIPKKKG